MSKLYEKTHVGTKALIEDYIDEVTKQINFICDVDIPGFGINDKLEFLKNTQKAFGRTALLLSGGGTFGLAHMGTVKALWEQKLLPRVVTGSSAGSIVAAAVGCLTDKELHILLDHKIINYNFLEREHEKSIWILKVARLFKSGCIVDSEVFNECMINNIGDITFAEAFNRTRRILNISVSSSTDFEMPKLLNYLTAPNVLIRSAVAASSSVPFAFRAAQLLAKDSRKNIIPWNPSGHKCVDGSIEGDLPMQRISELFGINHYLVAQLNPHVMPFLNTSNKPSTRLSRSIVYIAKIISTELQYRLGWMIEMGIYNELIFKFHAMFSQTYIGDITITPSIPWTEFPFVLSSPTVASVTKYAHAGEQAAWPRIAILRNHCLIERCLSENIVSLRKKLLDEDEQLDQTASNFNWYLPPVLTPNLTNNSGNPEKSDLSFDSMIELETSLEAKPKSQNNRLYVSSGNIRQRFSSINPSGNNPTKRLVNMDPLSQIEITYDDSDDDD
ncbi:acyl transferase/acyl hydrolase/lysophospholipase [Globomyces pollinis-pini]|nr:acyl transferase/acyl hydrolase/lysophospholipase [Globomyces pollinis-pini]